MKDDARRFLFTIVSIAAILGGAAGIHSMAAISVADIANDAAVAPIVIEATSSPLAAPVPKVTTKPATATAKKTTVTTTPVVATPAPVITQPAPVYEPVVYQPVVRTRRTSAS